MADKYDLANRSEITREVVRQTEVSIIMHGFKELDILKGKCK